MLISLMVGLYFSIIFSFSFVSHPIYYCLLLLLSSVDICGIVYLFMGFSWYLVLLCLVYIGGVYILFVFVSVYSPNTFLSSGVYWWWILFIMMFSFCVFTGCFYSYADVYFESSHYLCTSLEGTSYILLCLVLILGFICVSVVVNRKDSFYR
nr:NADH dehydrogenase subunit 6 [Diplostomoidea sp. MSB para 30071]